ncbi:YcxB family protein [Streptomyces sp. SAS_267]|uniref:YcxB family protein n=1 Tax=unclassified Streptomyces TaxID=2593676 RepID=UPI0036F75280
MAEGQGAAQHQELPGQPQGPEADAVELEYRPVVEDFTSALIARRGVSRAGRIQRRMFAGVGFCVVMGTAASVISGEKPDFLLVWLLFCVLLVAFMPRLQARQIQRLSQQRGTFRVTVTDAGVSVVTDNTTASVDWTAQPRYRERPDVFVMFSGDKNASCFTVLPKRAVRAPEDVDRLRAILDSNATRV